MLRVRLLTSLLASLLASLFMASAACAWGSEGHRIIGTIASANFDDATASAVRELLGDATVADACCWADEVRSDRQYDWIKPLHYINVPRGAERIDLQRDGADGQQIIATINKYRDILKDSTKSREERLLALRLVLHMVGDLHQPLHVSYKDDLGGNKLELKAFGRKSNLHRAWDSDLIQRRLKDTKGGWPVMSADLRTAITAEQREQWSKSLDPLVWANESLVVTRRVYADMPKAPGDVDDSYYAKWMPTVNERLQAAGVRLAALLNDAFAQTAKGKSNDTPNETPKESPRRGKSRRVNSAESPDSADIEASPMSSSPEIQAGTIACTDGRLR